MNTPPDAMPMPDPALGPPDGMPQDAPTGMRPVDPSMGLSVVPSQADDDTDEFQARDRLAVELLLAAEGMAKAAGVAAGTNDADQAAKFASAAHDFVKAHVVLSPLEAADDLTHSQPVSQPPSQPAAQQQ